MSRRVLSRRAARAETPGTQSVAPAAESNIRAAQSGGHTLDEGTRRWFEARTGASLGAVRLHDDGAAADLAQSVGARAFTLGSHVFLGDGAGDRQGTAGRRLIAHELAHVVQGSGGPDGTIRRAPAPAPPATPTKVTFDFRGAIPLPPSGTRTLKAACDVKEVTWSIVPGTTTAAPGTSISATGEISIGAGQTPGNVNVRAINTAGAYVEKLLQFTGIPTGIASTTPVREPPGKNYGHVFDHVFTSSTGKAADLDGIAVGEKFPKLATPEASTHVIPSPPFPFGTSLTLETATLTPEATDNWFLTAAGGLGGRLDTVTTGHAGVDVGQFVASASNPSPARSLPVDFSVEQHFHWYNPLAATAAARWTDFATVIHNRALTNSSGTVAFVTTVNGVSDGGDAYVGRPAVTAATATPASTPKSAGAPTTGGKAPPPRTVALSVTALPSTLPTGKTLRWSIRGGTLGCSVKADPSNPARAILTIGRTEGTVTIRVADSSGTNFDDVKVEIT